MTFTSLILVYIYLHKRSKDGKIALSNCVMTNLIFKLELFEIYIVKV